MEGLPFFFPTVCIPLALVFALVRLRYVNASNLLLVRPPIVSEPGCTVVDVLSHDPVELPV